MKNGSNFIFIGGVPRSGTTIFQKVLDGHSQIYGGPEFDHLPNTTKLYDEFIIGIHNGRQSCFYSEDDVNKHFSAWISSFFTSKLEREKKNYFSEKTPSNLLVFDKLKMIFPSAKFIWIIRDPRANIHSFRKVYNKRKKIGKKTGAGENLIRDLELIALYLKKGEAFMKRHPEDCIMIYYEDFINNPRDEISRVCDFIGLAFEPGMLDTARENETSILMESKIDDIEGFYSPENYKGDLNAGLAGEWKSTMNNRCEKIIGHYLTSEGFSSVKKYNLPGILSKSERNWLLAREMGIKWVLQTIKKKMSG